MTDQPASPRTTLRRGADRAEYDRAAMMQMLRDGHVAHVGANTEEGPLVLPMAYGITDTTMYLHGALANSLLRAGADREVCVTVTLLDALVVSKSPFHHTMNYRTVVVRGAATVVTDPDERLLALRVITDHIVPSWETTRPVNSADLKATKVIAVPLAEMSGKVREGHAVNDPIDADDPSWCGLIPFESRWGTPETAPDSGTAQVPAPIAAVVPRAVSPAG